MLSRSKVLVIAGSDLLGAQEYKQTSKLLPHCSYAMTAITAIVLSQKHHWSIFSNPVIDPREIEKQILYTCKDIKPDAIKIGMLHSSEVISSVLRVLKKIKMKIIVLDPVLVAKGGLKLINDQSQTVLK